MKNKGFGGLLFVTVVLVAMPAVTQAEQRVQIEQVGVSTWHGYDTNNTNSQLATPILSIKIGDPSVGEQIANTRGGIDGLLWTPAGTNNRWIIGNHRDPRTAERETGDFRAVVRSRFEVGPPPMLNWISPRLISAIEYVVDYGFGIRIMLKPATDLAVASDLAAAIQRNLELTAAGPNP